MRKQLNIKNPTTGTCLEIDIWIPNFNLGFEFQDSHHYVTTWYYQNPQEDIQQTDYTKKLFALQNGISLVIVPCWWDGELESLRATINNQRPDLLQKTTKDILPIPLNPPDQFFQDVGIPDIGELMLASFPANNSYDTIFEYKWWMGEKYDGMRCCWNPIRKTLYSRNGNELVVLSKIENSLPSCFVDGEIWFGRGQFDLIHVLLSESSDAVEWYMPRLIAFDVPSCDFEFQPFEQRYKFLLTSFPNDHIFLILAMRISCNHKLQFTYFMQNIVDQGGEGVILRKAHSLYDHGKSLSLLKLKSYFEDKEAIVVTIDDKLVTLKMVNGETFTVPISDVHTEMPQVGEVVTFSFENYSRRNKIPIQPRIIRIRSDLNWNEVLSKSIGLHDFSGTFTARPTGYWTHENMRKYLENFSWRHNKDPLQADTWYSFSVNDLYQHKNGRVVLRKFGGYLKAVHKLFPEIEFHDSLFQRSSWMDVEDRRRFFETYARENRFDPLDPQGWYQQPNSRIYSAKGAYTVLGYHQYSVSQALLDLFPDINFDPSKLMSNHRHLVAMHNIKNRRKFFLDYASKNDFNPLVASNWYTQTRSKIMKLERAASVMHYYNNSVVKALLDLFPNIGLEKGKLLGRSVWEQPGYRRKFFEDYAKENNFDALIPDNWYNQSREKLIAKKGALSVIYHHNSSFLKALVDLFPDIKLEKSKLWGLSSWNEAKNRRKFFENYARQHSFNPLVASNWYPVMSDISEYKATNSVIKHHHKGSVAKALMDLFPEVSFDKNKLFARSAWHLKESRRQFFVNYAKQESFDPLDPEEWYRQPRSKIMNLKGASNVLYHHNLSVSQALLELFPEINIDKARLWNRNPKSDFLNRRKFFESYAHTVGFDPLNPLHWYSQSKRKLMSQKGISTILYYHGNSLTKALMELFPEIGFEQSKLWSR